MKLFVTDWIENLPQFTENNMWSVLAGIRFIDITGDKKSVFTDYFRQYAANTLYFRALPCPLTFKTGGVRAPA